MLDGVVALLNPISCFKWAPTRDVLMCCGGNSRLTVISLPSVFIADIPSEVGDLKAVSLKWSLDGKTVAVADKVKR